jgi:uncharacterized protein (TIRG00374 family)
MGRTLKLNLTVVAVLAVAGFGFYKLSHSPDWQNFDWHKLVQSLAQIRLSGLLVAILLMYFTYFLRACRWYEFIRPTKHANLKGLLVAQILGFGAVAVLGRPGDLVRPYLIAKQEDLPVSSQMAAWILERIYDTVAMILVVGLSFILGGAFDDTGVPVAPVLVKLRRAGLILSAVIVVGAILLVAYERRLRAGKPALRFLPEKVAHKVTAGMQSFAEGLASVRSLRAQILGGVYSLGIWVTISAAFWMVLQAFGPPVDDLNFTSSMLVMGMAIAGSVVQAPGVGGGSQVLAILALTEIYGVPPEIATSAGIALWALAFVAVVPLAAVIGLQQGISWGSLQGRGSDPPPPRVSGLRAALHYVRAHRRDSLPGGEEGRPPREIRSSETAGRIVESLREASGEHGQAGGAGERSRGLCGGVAGPGAFHLGIGRVPDGAAQESGQGRLRALRFGVPGLQRHP